jgi:hypothetical protein
MKLSRLPSGIYPCYTEAIIAIVGGKVSGNQNFAIGLHDNRTHRAVAPVWVLKVVSSVPLRVQARQAIAGRAIVIGKQTTANDFTIVLKGQP